tara:strand:- start:510 stop:1268 length:759 start_codon:yes stop_codon:yes gene_type:complete
MMSDLVSIITPMFNSSKYIEETLRSVINQTHENWELFIIDDGSSDNCVELVNGFKNFDDRIKLIINEENQGAAISRNIGIRKANGRYIAFLDSDDLWVSTKLEEQISFMSKNQLALSYSSYEKIDESGNHIKNINIVKIQTTYHNLLKSNYIGCLTAMIDLKMMEQKKIYMPKITTRHDHGLWLAIVKRGFNVSGNPKILAKYRYREGSISFSKFKSGYYQWKLYRDVEKINLLSSIYYMVCWAWYGFLKRI